MKKVLLVIKGGFLSQWQAAIEKAVTGLAELIVATELDQMHQAIEIGDVKVVIFTSKQMLAMARLLEQRYPHIHVVVYSDDKNLDDKIPGLITGWLDG